jgi:N-acetylmuramoyl-L-alanine amidase
VSGDGVHEWLTQAGLLTPWPSADPDETPALEWLASTYAVDGPASVAIPLEEASVLQWVQNLGTGAATGAGIGAAGGPWGVAIGAALGAVLGALQTALTPEPSTGPAPQEPASVEPAVQPPAQPMPVASDQPEPAAQPTIVQPPAASSASPAPQISPDLIAQLMKLLPTLMDFLKRPVLAEPAISSGSNAAGPPAARTAEGRSASAREGSLPEGLDPDIDEGVPEAYRAPTVAAAPEYPLAARFVPANSSNYRSYGAVGDRPIRRVVIHITDSGPSISETIDSFRDPRAGVSAHYVVGQDGEIVQMVRHNDVAWHARGVNSDSIGVEHVANTRGLAPTTIEYVSSAGLVRWLCDEYDIEPDRSHIVGHSEVAVTTHAGCPNAVWDWDYYMRLVTGDADFRPPGRNFRGAGERIGP